MNLPKIIEKYREELEKTLKTSNEITFSLEETKPWESKLGGCPYLESLDDYPIGAYERPMMFLAQINLEEMPPMADFPAKGILQFYIEDIDPYGLDELCKVRYIENYIKDETKLVKENPFHENYVELEPFERPGKITFTQRQMPISSSLREFDKNFIQKATDEECNALYDVCCAADSRVGGYPYFVQHEPAYYRGNKRDVLLLQLDMDDVCGIMLLHIRLGRMIGGFGFMQDFLIYLVNGHIQKNCSKYPEYKVFGASSHKYQLNPPVFCLQTIQHCLRM